SRRNHAQSITDRPAVAHNQPMEQIGRARLIAPEDRLGQLLEGLIFTKLVSVAEHRPIFPGQSRLALTVTHDSSSRKESGTIDCHASRYRQNGDRKAFARVVYHRKQAVLGSSVPSGR